MNRLKDYQTRIAELNDNVSLLSKRHALFSSLRLLAFLLVGVGVYFFAKGASVFFAIAAIVLFVVLIVVDFKLSDRLKLAKARLQFNTDELNAFKAPKHAVFSDGTKYINPKHAYSYDIDLFGIGSLFSHINRTVTSAGEKQLVALFEQITKQKSELEERQGAISELSQNFEFIQDFIVEKYLNPNVPSHKISDFLNSESIHYFSSRTKVFKALLYLLPALFGASCVLAVLGLVGVNIPTILFIVQLFYVGNFQKRINQFHVKVEHLSKNFKRDARLLKTLVSYEFTSKRLLKLNHVLINGDRAELKAIKRVERLLNAFENRLNVLMTFMLNGLFLRDLWLIVRVGNWLNTYKSEFLSWYDSIGELDAFVSLANYNYKHPDFVQPKPDASIFLDAKALGHPLITADKLVKNDFVLGSTGELFIVTGANMSGKSTFLRTVLINLVLASSGSKVCAASFVYKPASIFSSIRTFDNLIDDVSYFQAELIRLKQMMLEAEKGEPVVIAIDEPLKGTNSEDKRTGSMLLLEKIIRLPVCGLVATHDLELKQLAQKQAGFKLICFELKFDGQKIIYDYTLRQGVTSTMNATILMKNMGLI